MHWSSKWWFLIKIQWNWLWILSILTCIWCLFQEQSKYHQHLVGEPFTVCAEWRYDHSSNKFFFGALKKCVEGNKMSICPMSLQMSWCLPSQSGLLLAFLSQTHSLTMQLLSDVYVHDECIVFMDSLRFQTQVHYFYSSSTLRLFLEICMAWIETTPFTAGFRNLKGQLLVKLLLII